MWLSSFQLFLSFLDLVWQCTDHLLLWKRAYCNPEWSLFSAYMNQNAMIAMWLQCHTLLLVPCQSTRSSNNFAHWLNIHFVSLAMFKSHEFHWCQNKPSVFWRDSDPNNRLSFDYPCHSCLLQMLWCSIQTLQSPLLLTLPHHQSPAQPHHVPLSWSSPGCTSSTVTFSWLFVK